MPVTAGRADSGRRRRGEGGRKREDSIGQGEPANGRRVGVLEVGGGAAVRAAAAAAGGRGRMQSPAPPPAATKSESRTRDGRPDRQHGSKGGREGGRERRKEGRGYCFGLGKSPDISLEIAPLALGRGRRRESTEAYRKAPISASLRRRCLMGMREGKEAREQWSIIATPA